MPVTRSALASSAARSALERSAPGTCGTSRPASATSRSTRSAQRAQLGVKHHRVQAGQVALERPLAVLLPEEARVPQPRPQHALVAGDDRGAAVLGLRVGDRDEPRRQRARLVLQREVALVGPHRGRQHLGRQAHRVLVDPAHQHDRPLDEALQLVEEARVGLDPQPLALRQPLRLFADQPQPLVAVEHDPRSGQLLPVVREVADPDRPRRHEAVAERDVAALDRTEAERHDLAVEQADDRVQRPHPARLARAPAHRLGPGEAGQDAGQRLGQHVAGRPAALLDERVEHPALLLLALLEPVLGTAEARQEAVPGRLRRVDPRAPALDLAVGLAGRHAARPPASAGAASRRRSRSAKPSPARSSSAVTRAFRSSAARSCIRAGISSENSSSSSSGIGPVPGGLVPAAREPGLAAALRQRRARGRYSSPARSR